MNRMKGKKILAALGFFSIAGAAGGCSQPAPNIRYQIETDQPCQTMAYFSASDAWSMQFIGLWPQEKQNQIADWLFSTWKGQRTTERYRTVTLAFQCRSR